MLGDARALDRSPVSGQTFLHSYHGSQKIFMNLSIPLTRKNNQAAAADFYLAIFVSIQIIFNPFPQLTAVHEIAFYLSVLTFLIRLWIGGTVTYLKTPLLIPLGLFCLWAFVGLPFALDKGNSLHDIYAHLIKYMILFYFIVYCFASRERFIIMTWLIIVSSCLFALGIMIHYYVILGHLLEERLGLMHYGEMPTNIIAVISVFAALLSAGHMGYAKARQQKILAGLCLTILSLVTLATRSKGALIALFIGLFCIFAFEKKRLILFSIAAFLIIGVLHKANYFSPMLERIGSDPRMATWSSFIEMAKDYPVTGIGFGMQTYDDTHFVRKYIDRLPGKYSGYDIIRAPHNVLIDVAVRTGFIGLSLFLIILITCVYILYQVITGNNDIFLINWGRCTLAVFAALFIQGMLENVVSGPPAVITYIIFAMTAILRMMSNANTSHAIDNVKS